MCLKLFLLFLFFVVLISGSGCRRPSSAPRMKPNGHFPMASWFRFWCSTVSSVNHLATISYYRPLLSSVYIPANEVFSSNEAFSLKQVFSLNIVISCNEVFSCKLHYELITSCLCVSYCPQVVKKCLVFRWKMCSRW